MSGAHFDRWLRLFADTAREMCPQAAAEHFVDRARMIGASLELGIATHRGLLLSKGERLPPINRAWEKDMTPDELRLSASIGRSAASRT